MLPLRCYNLWMRHSCLGHVPGSGSWRWATEVPSPRYVPLDEARGLYVGDALPARSDAIGSLVREESLLLLSLA